MSACTDGAVGLDRENLAGRTRSILNRGGWGNPDVLLVETEGVHVVVKDFSKRSGAVREWLGPWLLRREARIYRALEGVDAVPRLIGNLDGAAMVLEYRPGVLLSRSLAGQLPDTFLDELQATIAEMHRRGIVHLDLRHRSNILAGDDGRPVVLDFASALRFDTNTRWGRWLVRLLGGLDRRALEKWRVRIV